MTRIFHPLILVAQRPGSRAAATQTSRCEVALRVSTKGRQMNATDTLSTCVVNTANRFCKSWQQASAELIFFSVSKDTKYKKLSPTAPMHRQNQHNCLLFGILCFRCTTGRSWRQAALHMVPGPWPRRSGSFTLSYHSVRKGYVYKVSPVHVFFLFTMSLYWKIRVYTDCPCWERVWCGGCGTLTEVFGLLNLLQTTGGTVELAKMACYHWESRDHMGLFHIM